MLDKGEEYMRLDSKLVMEGLNLLATFKGEPLAQIIRKHAGMMARYLVSATPPFLEVANPNGQTSDGGSLKARALGQAAVRRDIGRVYMNPRKIYDELRSFADAKHGQAMAKKYWKLIKNNEARNAELLLQRTGTKSRFIQHIEFDGGALHLRKRTKRGRINKGTKPVAVTNYQAAKEYTKKVESHVGYTKSGWVTAARQINDTGIAQIRGWITSKPGPGFGQDNTNDTLFPTIYLTNAVPWVSDTIPAQFIESVSQSFESSLVKEIERTLGKMSEKLFILSH